MFNVYMTSAKHLTYLSLIEILETTSWGLQTNEVVEIRGQSIKLTSEAKSNVSEYNFF